MTIKCSCCGEVICKYNKDFKACGGISIQIGEKLDIIKDFCNDCAKEIAKELLEEVLV